MSVKSMLAVLALLIALARAGIIYPQTLIVDAVEEQGDGQYALSLRSAAGFAYEAVTDMDDLAVGDVMAAILYCAGTPDDIRDDEVVAMRYSGFRQPPSIPSNSILLFSNACA